jgi:hypothetical protein
MKIAVYVLISITSTALCVGDLIRGHTAARHPTSARSGKADRGPPVHGAGGCGLGVRRTSVHPSAPRRATVVRDALDGELVGRGPRVTIPFDQGEVRALRY